MARRKKGRDISGWLVVDKPAGLTSTAVVNKVRWAFDAKKAGHAGTLDPDATGVLAIALGEATKTVPYVTDAMKAYAFTVRLGVATNTDDAEGEVIATSEDRPGDDALREALTAFEGEIMQVPPAFSAVKIDGERAYAKARAGEDVALEARPLFVESLEMVGRPDADHAELEMICGKGGYVRSIARDLGETLRCLGHVVRLRRVWSGPFELEDAITLDEVEELARTPALDERLLPLSAGLTDLPELPTTVEGATRLRNGNPGIVIAANAAYGDVAWASLNGEPIAVGVYKAGELHPSRVFVT
ncbi:MAG: tRNA pseudouridine(55) synthase TruB [Pseudomonadota bacterium]